MTIKLQFTPSVNPASYFQQIELHGESEIIDAKIQPPKKVTFSENRVTEVETDLYHSFLKNHPKFKEMIDNGTITILGSIQELEKNESKPINKSQVFENQDDDDED